MSYIANTKVREKRDEMLLERSKLDPQIEALLVENSEKELIPMAKSWINKRQKLKNRYNSLCDSKKENMIANVIKKWRIPTSTKNSRLFGGKRKTKKQRKHRKAGKSKKQRKTKTKTKTRKHKRAGNSKKY